MLRITGLAWGLTLVASGLAFGQQVIQENQTTTVAPGGATAEVRRVSQLIGSNVALQGNNNFGRVEDLVFDNNGRIGYLVVSSGGRNLMMPWNAANINYGRRIVTYSVGPQVVRPFFFEGNAWPNVWDQQYITRMNQVFPTPPGVVRERVKVRPNGEVRVKERIR
jgi:PRC-barrel domain